MPSRESSKSQSVCATWRRRSSSLPVNRRARRFRNIAGAGMAVPRRDAAGPAIISPRAGHGRGRSQRPSHSRLLGSAQTIVAAGGGQGARVVIYSP